MDLRATGVQLLGMAPPLASMRGHPEFGSWGERLTSLGRAEGLAPLRPVLGAIVDDGLLSLEPWNAFMQEQAVAVPREVYRRASEVAEQAVDDSPHAAFLLSVVALQGWAHSLGADLYEQVNGVPHPGWKQIPYACALASWRIGALDAAQQLVGEGYDTLAAAKYRYGGSLQEALSRYQRLAGKIKRTHDSAVADLAYDLYESCRPEEPHFRAEFGAMLWTLGMIPESRLFLSTSNPPTTLSHHFFRHIVALSLTLVPTDSLLQYIWLELKDSPPFSLRDHKALFAKINLVYGQLMLDAMWPVPPSQAYARTLIGWFRGDLSRDQANEYIHTYQMIESMFPNPMNDWVVYLRMSALAFLVGRRFDRIDLDAQTEDSHWNHLVSIAERGQELLSQHPDWPEPYSRPSAALFYQSGTMQLRSTDNDTLVQTVERFRASALSYWLTVVPPIPMPTESSLLKSSLEEEERLIEYLRGAYFLTLVPILPKHYRRHGRIMDEEYFTELEGTRPRQELDPDAGRQQINEIDEELRTLWTSMREAAPAYAERRLHPAVNAEALVRAICSHTAS